MRIFVRYLSSKHYSFQNSLGQTTVEWASKSGLSLHMLSYVVTCIQFFPSCFLRILVGIMLMKKMWVSPGAQGGVHVFHFILKTHLWGMWDKNIICPKSSSACYDWHCNPRQSYSQLNHDFNTDRRRLHRTILQARTLQYPPVSLIIAHLLSYDTHCSQTLATAQWYNIYSQCRRSHVCSCIAELWKILSWDLGKL